MLSDAAYGRDAKGLRPVPDWVKRYEYFWTRQLGRIKELAERKMTERSARETDEPETRRGNHGN